MGIHQQEKGAVSLFIVIFSALLITVVTVGFIQLVLSNQRQATTNDLSQSAYDSAQAGVEDGKRALLAYQNICSTITNNPAADATACSNAYTTIIGGGNCNQGVVSILGGKSVTNPDEVAVQQSGLDSAFNQAYTCVIIQPQTDDYLGTLPPNSSNIIPIKSQSPITSIEVQWYDSSNISSPDLSVSLLPFASIPISGSPASLHPPLYSQAGSGWGPNRPSIMRVQLMQFGSSFSLSDFNNTNVAGQSNANTLFLYPTGKTGTASNTVDEDSFTGNDIRRTPVGSPLPVSCTGTLAGGGYACNVKIDLPTPIGGVTSPTVPTTYIRLTALYNASNYRVTLYNSASGCDGKLQPCKFDGVEPAIDSTGRANTLYRRVDTRVQLLDTNFAYPSAALDVTGNLCKDFSVANQAKNYVNGCTP
jgi:hypothetical protein